MTAKRKVTIAATILMIFIVGGYGLFICCASTLLKIIGVLAMWLGSICFIILDDKGYLKKLRN